VLPEKDSEITKSDSLESLKDTYLQALKSEIYMSPLRGKKIYTLYLGGGTPYQL
jgi:coproporphyrinogen III oxidase-like Fe-S oxidoreductase